MTIYATAADAVQMPALAFLLTTLLTDQRLKKLWRRSCKAQKKCSWQSAACTASPVLTAFSSVALDEVADKCPGRKEVAITYLPVHFPTSTHPKLRHGWQQINAEILHQWRPQKEKVGAERGKYVQKPICKSNVELRT